MTGRTWLFFLITETALSFVPGPAVLFVISQSLRRGTGQGLAAALGIVSANIVWFALSALGIGALLIAAGPWFMALKWAGAAYLVLMALWPFLPGADQAEDRRPAVSFSARGVWLRGVLLQLTNPKALVFFVALLPQFISTEAAVWPQMLILGTTSVVTELPVLALYAAVAGRASRWTHVRRVGYALDAVAGMLLIAAAVGVALS